MLFQRNITADVLSLPLHRILWHRFLQWFLRDNLWFQRRKTLPVAVENRCRTMPFSTAPFPAALSQNFQHDSPSELTSALTGSPGGSPGFSATSPAFKPISYQAITSRFQDSLKNLTPTTSVADLAAAGTSQGQMREATILFCDIRGYTTLVEQYPPAMIIHQLNEYFSAMTQVIFSNYGRLDKYMGDEIMAFFEPTDGTIASSARNGVKASIEMQRVLARLNQKWKLNGFPTFNIGIGINTGQVFVGNIGSLMRMDYTVIGDNVNLASRLEQLNKMFNTQIIMSDQTYDLVKTAVKCQSLGTVPIRGRQQPVKIYEVVDLLTEPPSRKSPAQNQIPDSEQSLPRWHRA